MLTIPLEKLAYIITKAREFDVEVPPVDEDSGSNPSDDAEWDVLEAGADNPTYQELADAINSLSDLERIELLALTWLGRGDYSKEDWREALKEARRIHDEKETDYLIGTPLLADYLEEGLSQLGFSIEDFEIVRDRSSTAAVISSTITRGIGGYEEFRGDLALMYFPRLDAASGTLVDLKLVPLKIARFQLHRAS